MAVSWAKHRCSASLPHPAFTPSSSIGQNTKPCEGRSPAKRAEPKRSMCSSVRPRMIRSGEIRTDTDSSRGPALAFTMDRQRRAACTCPRFRPAPGRMALSCPPPRAGRGLSSLRSKEPSGWLSKSCSELFGHSLDNLSWCRTTPSRWLGRFRRSHGRLARPRFDPIRA